MRSDKIIADSEVELYTPTIEETVRRGAKNFRTNLERCLIFISHRLKDSKLTDDVVQQMLNGVVEI